MSVLQEGEPGTDEGESCCFSGTSGVLLRPVAFITSLISDRSRRSWVKRVAFYKRLLGPSVVMAATGTYLAIGRTPKGCDGGGRLFKKNQFSSSCSGWCLRCMRV
uniref:Uncharacterized protein n=1 Tax=Knipowitschia caucasica TaxID=637954 RepID=A0AAV2JZN0_KNICA